MNAKNAHLIYIIFLIAGLLSGACCDEENEPRLPGMAGDTLARTLIIYMAAENSLHSDMQTDSLEIAWGLDSIPEDSRVVLFMDDMKSSRLCAGSRKEPLQVFKTFDSDICSTDSLTMASVFREILRNYPARSYGLVLCSHASGWLFDDSEAVRQAPSRRSFGIDNGKRLNLNEGKRMNIPTLAGVLRGLPHLDFLMFDACFMQCVEVAYELRHTADYILASPAEIPATGAPYTTLLRDMCTVPTDVESLAKGYLNYYQSGVGNKSYGGVELSVIRSDRLGRLLEVTAPLLQRLLANRTSPDLNAVQQYYPDLTSGRYTAFYDLKHLFYSCLDADSYEEWVQVFDEAVPVQALSPNWYSSYGLYGTTMKIYDIPHCGGVSVYVPREEHVQRGWVEDYHQLLWYKDAGLSVTNW